MSKPFAPIAAIAGLMMFLTASVSAQPPQAWVARYNGGFSNQLHTPLAMSLDNAGNIYVAGSSQNASNVYDYVLLKYAPGGTQLFAARYSSTNGANYSVNGFALDQNGNSYETGTGGTVKFGANGALAWTAPYSGNDVAVDTNGNTYVTGFSSSTYATVKLDPSGSNLWLQTYANEYGYTPVISQKVAVDNAGHVFVAGYETWIQFIDEDGRWWAYAHRTVIMYDGLGNPIWTNAPIGGYVFGTTKALIPDNQGNIYVMGNGDTAYSTRKINATSQAGWGQGFGSPPPSATAMALDTNGNAYLTGGHYANVKMDSTNGAIDWLIYQDSGSATANGIALDSVANVFVTGLTNTSTGGNDFATIKYDNNGNQLWVARYNGPANGNDGGNAIAVAPDGFIYVTGYSANASGGTDIVTIKYAPGPFLRKQANGNFLLQAEGAAGQSFDFQASTNLQAWQDLGTNTADTNGTVQFLDTNSLSFPSRFYLATPQ